MEQPDNGQSERTRAATERACPELIDAAKALDLDGKYADEHCEKVAAAIQRDMGLPLDGAKGQDAPPCFDGDGLRFGRPIPGGSIEVGKWSYDDQDWVHVGYIRKNGRFFAGVSLGSVTAAQLRRIAMACESVGGK